MDLITNLIWKTAKEKPDEKNENHEIFDFIALACLRDARNLLSDIKYLLDPSNSSVKYRGSDAERNYFHPTQKQQHPERFEALAMLEKDLEEGTMHVCSNWKYIEALTLPSPKIGELFESFSKALYGEKNSPSVLNRYLEFSPLAKEQFETTKQATLLVKQTPTPVVTTQQQLGTQ